ncbi:MAG TPA: amidophosphoribosyltransferase [Myxococcota bacterium]|nr:amidophosphoribosyltransferase [Myxococcota bacterium]
MSHPRIAICATDAPIMCGFVAILGTEPAAPRLVLGLHAIQHRGQDAAGIGTLNGSGLHLHKGMGMIGQAVPDLERLTGSSGIAHVRYPTAGVSATSEDAQPFFTRRMGLLLAHNGNVTNVPEVTEALRRQGVHVMSQCDAEPILLVLAQELTARRASNHTKHDLRGAIDALFSRVRGAFSVVLLMELEGVRTLVAFRDPHGIRPGVYGRTADGWIAASESVSLDVLGVEKLGDLPCGAALLFQLDREPELLEVAAPQPRPCVFERIYFARPDSRMEDGRVNRTRWRLGRQLAREWKARGLEADVVVAVPDSSRPAAMAMAEELGIKNREGFIKNRYSGRTFIMPDQASRDSALRLKLNPIREIFEGQRVLLVDDSIVRGSTMGRIVRMVRGLGPSELHVAIFSPPVRYPCFYGIDMPTREELIAARMETSVLAEYFGTDSLTYLSREGLAEVGGESICAACFDGCYVVPVSADERAQITANRRPRSH